MSSNTKSADDIMIECLDLKHPKSFFLFAGAGSGKTRSLVEVLNRFKNKQATELRKNGQKVAIITYTNAARDEIEHRLGYDPAFTVSTIHSFTWNLIQPYTEDIRVEISKNLRLEIEDLEQKQAKGRVSKASEDRARKIISKNRRLEKLNTVNKFVYSPTGENSGIDALNHSEVITLAASFLNNKPLLAQIMTQNYPVLLIDESQDTNKALINAFFNVEAKHADTFSLGLFGDTMQRIYTDGEVTLGNNIPIDWERPVKTINYRSPKRIIKLINKIREQTPNDNQQQEFFDGSKEGFARLFIVKSEVEQDKMTVELSVKSKMAQITKDDDWNGVAESSVKTLCLEHKMTARRAGFSNFFDSLSAVKSTYTGLLNGKMRGLPFFIEQIIPFVQSVHSEDEFEKMRILRKFSPLMRKEAFEKKPLEQLAKTKSAESSLTSLWKKGEPTLLKIIREVFQSQIFSLPQELEIIGSRSETEENKLEPTSKEDKQDEKIIAWEKALLSKYSEIEAYSKYVSDSSSFGTHQGIKGLEFPRVTVILDDHDAGGWQWSYEKLFGVKQLSASDQKNKSDGNETSIDRTRRLFYVTCSRAEESLAVICYSENPVMVKNNALKYGWFEENEIIMEDQL